MHKQSARTAAPPRLLLIEDNRMGRLARKTVLDELGYRTTAVSTAQEALDCVSGDRFDLIITDYRLPGMSGADFIQKIRKTQPAVPIIIISGFVDSLGLTEKNTGADFVIQKGSNEVILMVRAVRSLLRRAQVRKKPPASQPGPPKARRKNA